MPVTAAMVGALLGLSTQMYSNALRKLPYMRHPWEHVLGMALGAVFVNPLVKWDAQLQVDLDKMLDKAKAANERRYFGIQIMSRAQSSHPLDPLSAVEISVVVGAVRDAGATPEVVYCTMDAMEYRGKVVSSQVIPGVQPLMDAMEYAECEAVVEDFPPFQDAMKKRGVEDMDLVIVDP